ncbi:NAD+ kinase [Fluviicoccus keumensis]|uniref:NAD kinase n=1 Tax=Fluviicoccus keumensis TaxID=1435465 RepID=A0A4Q7Z9L0_9GAMM|nr:NAD(+) kinase [Fluviicoccus keumensis]RZU47232.1 NAD+ kinase [Fluviicoccus keumensis]
MSRETFRNIGLVGRPGKASVVQTLDVLEKYLVDAGAKVIYDEDTARLMPSMSQQVCSRALMGEMCDLVIVVGGDGSLLHAARALARFKTPVLGVNRGRLGFLTDISPDELITKVSEVLSGNYTMDHRFLLNLEVRSNGSPVSESVALNDVVLHAGKSVHMIEFELYVEGEFVYRQRSDGLIIATPTGSTAYALSGGGPIMHPKLDAIVVVPMHPHTLSSRPIVVDGNSEIKIRICETRIRPMVSPDGHSGINLNPGDWLYIKKHPFKLRLIHPPGYDFYAACRTKLGWGSPITGDDDSE